MTNKNLKSQLEISSQLPTALVIGNGDFISQFLCQKLLSKNCFVYYFLLGEDEEKKKEDFLKKFATNNLFILKKEHLLSFPSFNYIFQIGDSKMSWHSGEALSVITKMASEKKAKFLLAIKMNSTSTEETILTQFLQAQELDWRIVKLKNCYGPGMDLESTNFIACLFKNAIVGKPLLVPGDGQMPVYPTYVSDVINGIFRAMFTQGTSGKTFTLVNPKKITALKFANLLRKEIKGLSISFIQASSISHFDPLRARQSKKEIGLKFQVSVKKGIKKTWDSLTTEKEKLPSQTLAPIVEVTSTKIPFKKFFSFPKKIIPKFTGIINMIVGFLFLILVVSLPFAFLGIFWIMGVADFKKAEKFVRQKDFGKANMHCQKSNSSLQKGKKILLFISSLTTNVGLTKQTKTTERFFEVLILFNKVCQDLKNVTSGAENATAIFFQRKEGDFFEEIKKTKFELGYLNENLGLATAQMEREFPFLTNFEFLGLSEELTKLRDELVSVREKAVLAEKILSVFPEVFGKEKKKVYLVLLQNNMELRPTGGFIGSFALLTVDKGRLLDFEVFDVYAADGQLKGYVKPPEPIKKYLGEDIWYLRDSNFSPHFSLAAEKAEWFLQKEIGRKVDGVVGLNLTVAQKVLEALGEVEVLDYQEKINAGNLFERAEYHSEINFFPGSTAKKDFLANLASSLFEKIKTASFDKQLMLFAKVLEALEEREMMIAVDEEKADSIFREFGWDGSLKTIGENTSKDVGDYLLIVEANFGVNKANYFLKREIEKEAVIWKEGEVKERLIIFYDNQSSSESWPAGRYKNYLRVYLPQGSKLSSVKVFDKKEGGLAKEIPESEIDNSIEDKKEVYGFLVEVPVRESRRVEIVYQLSQKLPVDHDKSIYRFYWQKQSGIGETPVKLKVLFPIFLKPKKITPEGNFTPHQIEFTTDLKKDRFFEIEFGK